MRNKLLTFLMLFLVFAFTLEEEEYYTYYGFVPSRMWYAEPEIAYLPLGPYTIVDVKMNSTLTILAYYDDTGVEVYTLPNKALLKTLSLGRMEKTHILLPNSTFFAVRTNKPIFALLTSGQLDTSSPTGPLPVGFHPSVDGAAVGKEFIFMVMAGEFELEHVEGWGKIRAPYRFVALEDAEIRIENETGASVDSFELSANTWKDLAFKSYRTYHVTSTGNIMIQTSIDIRSVYIPSVTGAYVGKAFYSTSNTRWEPLTDHGFQIIAVSEDAKVSVYDVEFGKKIQELTVPAKKSVSIKPKAVRSPPEPPLVLQAEIFIESDEPIVVSYVHHGDSENYGTGLTFLTVKRGEPTEIYVPANCSAEAYMFTYTETNVIFDQLHLKLPADSFFLIEQPGIHEISADAEVVIQITHWPNIPSAQALSSFASIIPSSQSARIVRQVGLKPIAGEETAIMSYAGAAAAAIVAIAAIYLFIRSRRSKSLAS